LIRTIAGLNRHPVIHRVVKRGDRRGVGSRGHVPIDDPPFDAMSKSALIGFTKGLARDLGDRGITVNLVQPGSTNTDMNPADGPTADDQRGLSALGRYADPTDIADAVEYLSGAGARNVTGALLTVDVGTNA
jgi:3-oxoacyl-[acyl-carrier protein] reductase